MIYAQEAALPIVAALDFSGEGASESELIAITNLPMSAVFDTAIVQVIDRNQREEILAEIAFSLSGSTDEECAIEAGRLLAADVMITGSIGQIGSRLAVDLKAFDVATSRISATFYELYESIDEIVDNVHVFGGQLVQNFTGKLAQKRAVLDYEELSVLQVNCAVEGASVFVDGASVGKITDGQISKAVNKGAEITLTLRKDDFYDYSEKVAIDVDEKLVQISMDKKILRRLSVEAVFGGGMMGSLYFSVFVIANWWFVSVGLGATVLSSEPMLSNLPLSAKTGTYLFWDYRSHFRMYAGGEWLWNMFRIYN